MMFNDLLSDMFFYLRDWCRGYTDKDLWVAEQKLIGPYKPGHLTYLTRGEFKAFLALSIRYRYDESRK